MLKNVCCRRVNSTKPNRDMIVVCGKTMVRTPMVCKTMVHQHVVIPNRKIHHLRKIHTVPPTTAPLINTSAPVYLHRVSVGLPEHRYQQSYLATLLQNTCREWAPGLEYFKSSQIEKLFLRTSIKHRFSVLPIDSSVMQPDQIDLTRHFAEYRVAITDLLRQVMHRHFRQWCDPHSE